MTTAMRAISQDVFGGPEVLKQVELDRPEAGLSQVLVRVHAAGLNPTDWKHRARRIFLGPPPFVLGWDVSGVVEAVGYGVTLVKPGDEVFGMLPYPHGVGSHAEYVTGPARAFTPKPGNVDHVQAAALPLAALTAWRRADLPVAIRRRGGRRGSTTRHPGRVAPRRGRPRRNDRDRRPGNPEEAPPGHRRHLPAGRRGQGAPGR